MAYVQGVAWFGRAKIISFFTSSNYGNFFIIEKRYYCQGQTTTTTLNNFGTSRQHFMRVPSFLLKITIL